MTNKTDLTDVTFLVPLRIDSHERKENADTLIKYTFRNFKTSFIVLEADEPRKFYPEQEPEGFQYVFIEDNNEVFHRTKWINHLISMAETPYVAVWDADAISPPEQIVEAAKVLQEGEAVMSFPYDGRFYSCDKVSCALFRKILNIEILLKRIPVMNLMHGYHSVGGAFIVNKEKYFEAGGENENFYGWGPEDAERVKRLEIMNFPIYYAPGVIFHLWHPQGKNSWFATYEDEKHNRQELQRTCKFKKVNKY
jgi:predicted glycosyltransferase involved in capsule biosynthesis